MLSAETLGNEELLELEDALREELEDRLTEILSNLNINGRLMEFLQLLSMEHLLHQTTEYQVHPKGKIIVLGQTNVKAVDLLGIAKKLGFGKDRFELHLEYDDAIRFNYKKLQWSELYSVILVGPMGHSGAAKGEHSSVITALESEPGYPPVIRLGNTGLKITKSDFRNKLAELKEQGKIA